MKYISIIILLLIYPVLARPVATWSMWLELKEVCEIRLPTGGKPVTYGANDYVKGAKGAGFEICQWAYVKQYARSK